MKFSLNKSVLVLTLVIAFFSFQGSALAYASNADGAKQFVNQVTEKVMSIAASGKSDSEKLNVLNEIFFETIDTDWIGKFAIGKYWMELNDEQKVNYLKTYRTYISASYVPLFKKYNGQNIIIDEIKNLGNDTFLAVTQIKQPDNKPSIRVEYRLKHSKNTFKVRDIIAEGVSLINTQRSDFSSIMNQGGFDGLIKKLSSKAAN